jgi:hypothetical protein
MFSSPLSPVFKFCVWEGLANTAHPGLILVILPPLCLPGNWNSRCAPPCPGDLIPPPTHTLFVILQFEWRASWLLGSVVPLEPHSQPFLALVISQIGSHTFCPGLGLDYAPSTSTTWIAGITGVSPQIWLIFCLFIFWPRLTWNFDPPISTSQVAGITSVHHHTWPWYLLKYSFNEFWLRQIWADVQEAYLLNLVN